MDATHDALIPEHGLEREACDTSRRGGRCGGCCHGGVRPRPLPTAHGTRRSRATALCNPNALLDPLAARAGHQKADTPPRARRVADVYSLSTNNVRRDHLSRRARAPRCFELCVLDDLEKGNEAALAKTLTSAEVYNMPW